MHKKTPGYLSLVSDALHDEIGPNALEATFKNNNRFRIPVISGKLFVSHRFVCPLTPSTEGRWTDGFDYQVKQPTIRFEQVVCSANQMGHPVTRRRVARILCAGTGLCGLPRFAISEMDLICLIPSHRLPSFCLHLVCHLSLWR